MVDIINNWPVYRIYGIPFTSDFAFTNPLLKSDCDPVLSFNCATEAPIEDWKDSSPSFASPPENEGGESVFFFYHQKDYDVLQLTDVADFYLWADRIICNVSNQHNMDFVEIGFLGMVFSLWLEMGGYRALHASAVETAGHAVAFVGNNGDGKSSLAWAMMQSGCPLITDDVISVQKVIESFIVYPSYPQLRLWPEETDFFLGHTKDLERVNRFYSKRKVPINDAKGIGIFCDTAKPLGCIYRLSRYNPVNLDSGITIEPVSPANAIKELIGHSFTAEIIETAGLEVERLRFFAQMVRKVPVRRVVYPSGLDRLGEVCDVILDDVSGLMH